MEEGHYEAKHKKSFLLALSHGSRLHRAVKIAKDLPGRRLLDFGSGDGVLERMLANEPGWGGTIVAADMAVNQIEDCQKRLKDLPNTRFITLPEVDKEAPFETIMCLEVLEHVIEVEKTLDYLKSLLKSGGHLVVSVPVETGLVLVGKQLVRFRLGGDYRFTEQYSARELVTAMLPTQKKHVRPIYEDGGAPYHGHKLFNWRWMRKVLGERFILQQEFGTPFPFVSSQRWFVCQKPA